MKIENPLYLFAFIFMASAFTACDSDDDNDDMSPSGSDEELITDLVLTFDNADAQTTDTYTFSDPDGPGGNPPAVDVIALVPGAYVVSISVLDASDPNNVEDLTGEITQEEADEHQFFFELLNVGDGLISIDYLDSDEDGNPIGAETLWSVTGATSGNEIVRVTLLHESDKDAPDAAEGILTPELGGETDIQVEFEVTVTE
jgi:hypothetical protein